MDGDSWLKAPELIWVFVYVLFCARTLPPKEKKPTENSKSVKNRLFSI
jgi:hypothetical protein